MYILPIYKLLFWEPKRLTHESHEHLSKFHVNRALLGWTNLLFPWQKGCTFEQYPWRTNEESREVDNSEFTQQDGRKKRTAKRLSVTNVTGLLLACFVANSLKIDVSYSSTKRSVQRNVKFGGSKAKAKLLSRLSHKVCRRLSSPVLLRKFTIVYHQIWNHVTTRNLICNGLFQHI